MASGPITSWEIDGETVETVADFILFGSKITADGDCSHEIKGCLFLGRQAMTNPDSILKSRDIALPTKVNLVKAMVFPVVIWMWELDHKESWALKNWRIDAFELWCWRRLLRIPWTARISNHSILKEINPEYSLEGLFLKLKLQYFRHLMWKANLLKKTLILGKTEGRRRREWQRMRCGMVSLTHGHEFEQAQGFGDGQGSLVFCSLWGHKESADTIERLNWTNVLLLSCLPLSNWTLNWEKMPKPHLLIT